LSSSSFVGEITIIDVVVVVVDDDVAVGDVDVGDSLVDDVLDESPLKDESALHGHHSLLWHLTTNRATQHPARINL